MSPPDFVAAEQFIRHQLTQLENKLSPASVGHVNHCLEHAEYELAFESLFIEIMQLPTRPNIDWKQSGYWAKQLSLDLETVYSIAFWSDFQAYIRQAGS